VQASFEDGELESAFSIVSSSTWIGFLNDLFYDRRYIADWESCQFPFVLDEKATVVAGGAVGKRRERRERFFIAPLGRSQGEPRRRLALACGFALFRSFGIDRLDAPAYAAGRGWAGPDGRGF
jgi:hypothetical protein